MITPEEIREELTLAASSYMVSAIEASNVGARAEADADKIRADLCIRFLEEWFGESLDIDAEMQVMQDILSDIY